MRYLEVAIDQKPAERHPMHQFVVEHESYDVSRLLYRRQYSESDHAAIFHIDGPRDPYVDVLTQQSTVSEFETTAAGATSFYLYVQATMERAEVAVADAFSQPGVLVIPPVDYRSDGSIRVTAVGPAETVQAAVDAVPETMRYEIRSVGEFSTGRIDPSLDVTQRQFAAIEHAVSCGYYRNPREATLEDVAAELECSASTAGEILRRAERTVMSHLVDGGPF